MPSNAMRSVPSRSVSDSLVRFAVVFGRRSFVVLPTDSVPSQSLTIVLSARGASGKRSAAVLESTMLTVSWR